MRCLFIMHWGDTGPAISSLIAEGIDCKWTSAERTEDRIRWILDDIREHPPDIFVPNLVVAAYLACRWIKDAGISTIGILHSDDPFYHAIQTEFIFGAKEYRLDAVVCVSRQIEDDVRLQGATPTRVRRIPYGVPIPHKRVSRSGFGLRLAYVGRLAEEQKRISEVVHALALAVREIPGTSAIIYGDGPERTTVERLISNERRNGLNITLAGNIDSEQMQDRMLEADIIVLLSDYEGLPIALLEAMACGCVPVCLRGRSGIPELVEDSVTGVLVNDRDSGFVSAIEHLSENSELWDRLSRAAKERASLFSAEKSAGAWMTLLNELSPGSVSASGATAPRKLELPPVNPALASADRRIDPQSFYTRARMRLGSWRRLVVG